MRGGMGELRFALLLVAPLGGRSALVGGTVIL